MVPTAKCAALMQKRHVKKISDATTEPAAHAAWKMKFAASARLVHATTRFLAAIVEGAAHVARGVEYVAPTPMRLAKRGWDADTTACADRVAKTDLRAA